LTKQGGREKMCERVCGKGGYKEGEELGRDWSSSQHERKGGDISFRADTSGADEERRKL